MEPKITFWANAPVFPSEDPDKVEAALLSLFPEAATERAPGRISASFDSVEHLVRLITDQKTRYAFLQAVGRSSTGSRFSLKLNKQAACVSKVNVVDEPKPLGSIEFGGELPDPLLYFEKELDAVGFLTARRDQAESQGEVEAG